MSIKNGLPYVRMWPATQEDMDNLPRIQMTKDEHWDPSIFDNDLADDEHFYDTAETEEEAANIEVHVSEVPKVTTETDEESDDEEPPELPQRTPRPVGRRAFITNLQNYIDSDPYSSSEDEYDSDEDSVRIVIQRHSLRHKSVFDSGDNDDKSESNDTLPGLQYPDSKSETSDDMPPLQQGTADDSSVSSDEDLGASLLDPFETAHFNPIAYFDHDIEQQWAIVMGHKYPTRHKSLNELIEEPTSSTKENKPPKSTKRTRKKAVRNPKRNKVKIAEEIDKRRLKTETEFNEAIG